MSHFLFTELEDAALTEGKAFDAMVIGTFTDMRGREIEFTPKDLKTYIANTRRAIEATTTEGGEVVGLPIDAQGHDKGDGAGWIVGVELVGEKIRVVPKWTEIGRELISKGIRRFFSATVDVANKIILGGTLTNWPATRSAEGIIALRPIELSEDVQRIEVLEPAELQGETENDAPESVEWSTLSENTIAETDASKTAGALYIDGGQMSLPIENGGDQPRENSEELDMTKDEIIEFMRSEFQTVVQEAARAAVPQNGGEGEQPEGEAPKFDILKVLDMEGTKDEMVAEFKQYMLDQHAAMRQEAQREAARQLAAVRREATIAEFSQKVTGGTEDVPYGVPVNEGDLKEFLMRLGPGELEFAIKMLSAIQEHGRTEFTELGHGKRMRGTAELPDVYKGLLDEWVNGGNKVAEFFRINPELGEMGQYNLAEYEGSK